MRRIASCLVIALLLSSLSACALRVLPVKAQSTTIIINPDGSITPFTVNITTCDEITYSFTGSNYLPIVVNRSNIIIDGNGHTLQASGGNGFSLTGMSNVTIKNTTITNCGNDGILLSSSSGNELSGNNITANSYASVELDHSSGNTLSVNTAATNNFGILLDHSSSNTILGNNVSANHYEGVSFDYCDNNTLSNNNVRANDYSGFHLYNSSGNVLSSNNITANPDYGILLDSSCDNNTLADNTVTANSLGISLYSSSNNVLSGNVMANNTYNFDASGSASSDFVNDIDASNLVDGKPVYYLLNQSSIIISSQTYPEGVGYLSLVDCSNVTVVGLTLAGNMQGLLLAFTNDSRINDNTFTTNRLGVDLYCSSSNILSGNIITANTLDGVWLDSSSDNNTLSGNGITANNRFGISLFSSSGNVISANDITTNGGDGIYLRSSLGTYLSGNDIISNGIGVELVLSSGDIVSRNNITANTNYGVDLYYCSGNVLSGNNITANTYSVYFYDSSGNRIFHNDFSNSTNRAYISLSSDTWDDGYPSGGNYWSDYSGVDQKSGPYQDLMGSDGIGDTSYTIDSSNVDQYPLMASFKSPNVTWSHQTFPIDTVSSSLISDLHFNATTRTLTFDVTATNSTTGFCRIAIPKALMWCDTNAQWMVSVNGTLIANRAVTNDTSNTYIYFTYHHSTESIQIKSTGAVPEIRPLMLMPLFMVITLLGAMAFKKKAKRDSAKDNKQC